MQSFFAATASPTAQGYFLSGVMLLIFKQLRKSFALGNTCLSYGPPHLTWTSLIFPSSLPKASKNFVLTFSIKSCHVSFRMNLLHTAALQENHKLHEFHEGEILPKFLLRKLKKKLQKEKQKKKKKEKPAPTNYSSDDKKNRRNIRLLSKDTEDDNKTEEKRDKDTVFGSNSFSELGLTPEALKALENMNITRPTQIQEIGIPSILKHTQNCILAAPTGTGKTLAYLLPIMQLLKQDEVEGVKVPAARPRALVLLPSRELATQVLKVAKSISHFIKLRARMLSGGFGVKKQKKTVLKEVIDILVCTPGRLLLHMDNNDIYLSKVKYVVVDEADSLFGEGFKEDLQKVFFPIQKRMEAKKDHVRFIFVGATFSKSLIELINKQFPNTKKLISSSIHHIHPTLKQSFIPVTGDKQEQLLAILQKDLKERKRVIVFCNTIPSCRSTDHFLNEHGIQTSCYHGEIKPTHRERNYRWFVKGERRVLVCTDIASRGLDTIMVDHVILFDFPLNVIDYLHRVGRTARVGRPGKVTALITKRDRALANNIMKAIQKKQSLENVTASLEMTSKETKFK